MKTAQELKPLLQNIDSQYSGKIISYIESLENKIDGLNDTIDYLRNEIANLEEEIISLKLVDL